MEKNGGVRERARERERARAPVESGACDEKKE